MRTWWFINPVTPEFRDLSIFGSLLILIPFLKVLESKNRAKLSEPDF